MHMLLIRFTIIISSMKHFILRRLTNFIRKICKVGTRTHLPMRIKYAMLIRFVAFSVIARQPIRRRRVRFVILFLRIIYYTENPTSNSTNEEINNSVLFNRFIKMKMLYFQFLFSMSELLFDHAINNSFLLNIRDSILVSTSM